MSEHKAVTTNEKLHQGIDAARAGRTEEARRHLISVLKQDANNIPALLWLAFVFPSPQDAIRLLEQVLALDPENERAKAGIRWASGRLKSQADEAPAQEMAGLEITQPIGENKAADVADAIDDDRSGEGFTRQRLLSSDVQKQTKKGALAQRARRTINPLLTIIFITGTLGIVSIGLGAEKFVSPETLTVWLPPGIDNVLANSQAVTAASKVPLVRLGDVPAVVPADRLYSDADTLSLEIPHRSEASLLETDALAPTIDAELSSEAAEPLPAPEPPTLIGPERPSTVSALARPVKNLRLAHQPAYPGEKWIEVNVSTQQITAWEGDVPVFSFAGSTGLPNTPTVLGEFHVYWKLEATVMSGSDYYLPGVPYTMYFYAGYALHGTYWHNNFGQPMSRGCVNLETGDAKKLFEWADPVIPPGQTEVVASPYNPGTLVVIHQ